MIRHKAYNGPVRVKSFPLFVLALELESTRKTKIRQKRQQQKQFKERDRTKEDL